MRVTPIGLTLEVAGDRAPSTLHLMSLVATGTEALITVVMRMHWPPDGSSSDLEITEAGPQHLPYDRLWAVDDEGTRYTARFEAGQGRDGCLAGRHPAFARALAPRPVAGPDRRRDPPPPASPPACRRARPPARAAVRARAHGDLARRPPAHGWKPNASWPPATPPDQPRAPTRARSSPCSPRPVRSPPGTRSPVSSPRCASDSARPGTASPSRRPRTSRRSGPASSRTGTRQRRPAPPSCSPRWPRCCRTSTGRGSRLAGLSSAAGESHLHVVSIGLPPLADRFAYNWTPGFSWWLTDGGGNWHVGTAGEPWTFGDGTQAFRLRLTPPLTALPDAAELVLTGPSTRIRVRFPSRAGGVPAAQLSRQISSAGCGGARNAGACWCRSRSWRRYCRR